MGVMTNEQILARIKGVLEDLRPNIQMDGGDIEFVSYVDGVVSLKLQGACASCPLSVYTIKLGIEERLREFVPEVIEVIAV
jgi:Fe-S cluster biogenesis protein NfuA